MKWLSEEQLEKKIKSLPPRGAWIEIPICIIDVKDKHVAPPTGSVD